MDKFITKGTVAAALSIAAILAGAFGRPAFGAFLNDPATVEAIFTVVGIAGTLYAGAAQGLTKKAE